MMMLECSDHLCCAGVSVVVTSCLFLSTSPESRRYVRKHDFLCKICEPAVKIQLKTSEHTPPRDKKRQLTKPQIFIKPLNPGDRWQEVCVCKTAVMVTYLFDVNLPRCCLHWKWACMCVCVCLTVWRAPRRSCACVFSVPAYMCACRVVSCLSQLNANSKSCNCVLKQLAPGETESFFPEAKKAASLLCAFF